MNGITIITFLIASFIAVAHGHYSGRIRNNVNSLHNMHRDLSLSCSCDDLTTLVTLVRALMEDKECSSAGHAPSGSICNADDLIMNLVNALIQLTTQALNHNCHCPNQSGNNNPGNGGSGNNHPHYNGGSGNNYPHYNGGSGNNHPHYNDGSGNNHPHYNGDSGYSHSDGGLLNLDLLNQNKKDNVLDLDLAKQHLLGVGLGGGGGNSQGSDSYYNKYNRNANGGNDEGLINVDLLNQKKTGNVADVDVEKQHIAGVGLGGGSSTSASSQSSTNTKSMTGSSGNKSNNGEGLLNVDLLNPNKQNDVVDVDVVGKTVLGIGVGNSK